MSDRTFTLDEAHMLLPILESLLKQAIHGKKLIEDVDAELQETAHRVFLNGGMLLNVVHLARRKADRQKAIRRIKDALAEIDATGVQVKDIDIGLLDFPAKSKAKPCSSAGNSANPTSPTGTAPVKALPDASPSTTASPTPARSAPSREQRLDFNPHPSPFRQPLPHCHPERSEGPMHSPAHGDAVRTIPR